MGYSLVFSPLSRANSRNFVFADSFSPFIPFWFFVFVSGYWPGLFVCDLSSLCFGLCPFPIAGRWTEDIGPLWTALLRAQCVHKSLTVVVNCGGEFSPREQWWSGIWFHGLTIGLCQVNDELFLLGEMWRRIWFVRNEKSLRCLAGSIRRACDTWCLILGSWVRAPCWV